jgi:hypothetical protein
MYSLIENLYELGVASPISDCQFEILCSLHRVENLGILKCGISTRTFL